MKNKYRVAAIDMGTNSFLCLIADVQDGKIVEIIEDHSEIVRLGQDVHKNRFFHPDALKRAKKCLQKFSQRIGESQVQKIKAVATSAARDVSNGEELLNLGDEFAIPIEIIEGQREAELTYRGALLEEQRTSNVKTLVLDIGGGSTECMIEDQKEILGQSVDVGAVRLTEMFIKEHPFSMAKITKISEYTRAQIKKSLDFIDEELSLDQMVAVAGTPTTLALLELGGDYDREKIEGFTLSRELIESWLFKMSKVSVEERVNRWGVPKGRADILPTGCVILLSFLDELGLKECTVSTRGVRYGLAVESK